MLGRSLFYLLGLTASSLSSAGFTLSLCAHSTSFPAGGDQPCEAQQPDELLTQLSMLFIFHTCLPLSLIPVVSTILKHTCSRAKPAEKVCRAWLMPQQALGHSLQKSWVNWFCNFSSHGQPKLRPQRKQGKWSSIFPMADKRTQTHPLNSYLEWNQSYMLPSLKAPLWPL